MKTALPPFLLGALGLLFTLPITPLRAGSAVATDGHGAYGYAYGDDSLEELRAKAVRNCRRHSACRGEVRVVFNTGKKGYGTILRFYIDGEQHVAAVGGSSSERAACRSALGYVEEHGGGRWEVAETWSDD